MPSRVIRASPNAGIEELLDRGDRDRGFELAEKIKEGTVQTGQARRPHFTVSKLYGIQMAKA
jgi:hypothetical protein